MGDSLHDPLIPKGELHLNGCTSSAPQPISAYACVASSPKALLSF